VIYGRERYRRIKGYMIPLSKYTAKVIYDAFIITVMIKIIVNIT